MPPLSHPISQTPNPHSSAASRVAGIGELLWDVFPNHRRMGGAPANFAFHCGQLGATAAPVSCIGNDEAGKSLLQALTELGVVTSYIATSDAFATGTVKVSLSSGGKPSYEIAKNTAWDHIPFTPELGLMAATFDAVCFGTLGQRSTLSRKTIHNFLGNMPASAIKIFDVNLRQDYFNRELIEQSLQLATILKVSDEELPVLAQFFDLRGDTASQLESLRTIFNLDLIAYTRGSKGSLLVGAGASDDHPGIAGEAVDTVGAGDSFTAALCMGLLAGWSLGRINDYANRIAAFVCSQKGATPKLPADLVIAYNHAPSGNQTSVPTKLT